jgi:hypothetical protein
MEEGGVFDVPLDSDPWLLLERDLVLLIKPVGVIVLMLSEDIFTIDRKSSRVPAEVVSHPGPQLRP